MTQSNDDGAYDFGKFSLIPNIEASPLLLKDRESGQIWPFDLASDGTLADGVTTRSNISPQALKGEAHHACNEILKRLRKPAPPDPMARYR